MFPQINTLYRRTSHACVLMLMERESTYILPVITIFAHYTFVSLWKLCVYLRNTHISLELAPSFTNQKNPLCRGGRTGKLPENLLVRLSDETRTIFHICLKSLYTHLCSMLRRSISAKMREVCWGWFDTEGFNGTCCCFVCDSKLCLYMLDMASLKCTHNLGCKSRHFPKGEWLGPCHTRTQPTTYGEETDDYMNESRYALSNATRHGEAIALFRNMCSSSVFPVVCICTHLYTHFN